MALKTDYKDAMFDGNRKYRITENDDGTVTIEDVTIYTQAGDKFGANDVNGTNEEVNRVAGELETAKGNIENKAESNHTHSADDVGAAPSTHTHAAGDIASGTLGVAHGGTGATTFTSGAALIGNGTGAVATRAITNLTAKGAITGSTNLATANAVLYHAQNRLNRTTAVNAADTGYTTYMGRAIALVTSAPSSLTNGCCAFVYS